jgi:hypothetical protein
MGSSSSLRRVAQSSAIIGVTRLPDFDRNQAQPGPAQRLREPELGLQRALSDPRDERDRSNAGRDHEAFRAIERVREIADHLRAADQRISDLEAGLQATRERAQRELRVAAEHAEKAQAQLAAAAARADAAERRAREAEERLNEILAVIDEELSAGRARG